MTTKVQTGNTLAMTNGVEVTHVQSPVATDDLFVVTGLVKVMYLFGVVGTVIQAKANTMYLQQDPVPAGPATSALSDSGTPPDMTGTAAGSIISLTAVAAADLITTSSHMLPASTFDVGRLLLMDTTIETVNSDSSTGSITWYCVYVPLSTGATVTDAP